jgi:hypothetical protein
MTDPMTDPATDPTSSRSSTSTATRSTTGPATAPAPNPFALLRLPADPDLTDDEVHRAWRRQMRVAHPDRGGTTEAAAALTAAYEQLRSAVRRAEILDQLDTQLVHPIRDHASRVAGTELLRGSDERSYAPSTAPDTEPTVGGVDRGARWERAKRSPDARVGSVRRPNVLRRGWVRLRYGRPHWLLVRVLLAAALPVIAYIVRPDDLPTWITLAVGGATWLAATAHLDLAPRSPR